MESLLLQQVRLTDPQSPQDGQIADIRLRDGRIVTIAAAGSLSPEAGEATFMREGAYVSPGWVDMQTHLSDPGFEPKENLAQLAQAGSQGGFTTLLTYPNT
ncbi:MAG: dihydroorotase, partial [Bacteroidetes bacterium]